MESTEPASPLFSVVTPLFNRRDMIEGMIESVRAQTEQSFEIIVVDDGSTDGSAEVAKRLGVTVLEQANSGPGAARNRGVEHARGRYIAFLDSDDLWFPWTLEVYRRAIEANDEPAFVAGRPTMFSTAADLESVACETDATNVFKDYLDSGDEWRWFGVSSFIIRRDAFVEVGGFADGRINGEDAELALKLGTAPGFVQISAPATFGYRVHDGNVTLDTDKSLTGLRNLIDGEAKGRFPGGPGRAPERARIISRHIRPAAVQHARAGHCAVAFELYKAVLGEAIQKFRWRFAIGMPLTAFAGWLRNPPWRRNSEVC